MAKKFTKESVVLDTEKASIHKVSFTSGKLKVWANAECLNKKFIGVTFPCIMNDGSVVGGTVVWNGNGFSTVDMSAESETLLKDFLKDFAEALAKEYGFTIVEIPEPSEMEMHEPTEEESAETINVEQSNEEEVTE